MSQHPSGTVFAPPIDLDHLRRQTMDDTELATELLDLFSAQARRIVEDLAAAGADRGRVGRREADLLHMLTGSARAVGAWAVAEQAARLERGARDGVEPIEDEADEAATVHRGFPALGQSVAEACRAIESLRMTGVGGAR